MNHPNKEGLVTKLLDEAITPEEFKELEHLLTHDQETRDIYQDHIMLDILLQKDHALGLPSLKKAGPRPQRLAPLVWRSAACLLIILTGVLLIKTSKPSPSAKLRFSENTSYSLEGASTGNQLKAGQELKLHFGATQLQLPHNVTGVIIGPAKFHLRDKKTLILDQGRASFQVPPGAEGFQVITPNFKAVDLGTEFTVLASWNQHNEVHVRKGTVEVSSKSSKAQTLSSQEAYSVREDGTFAAINYSDTFFQRDLPPKVTLLATELYQNKPLQEGEISAGLPSSWVAHGNPQFIGLFNPKGNGKWYDLPALNDTNQSKGIHSQMKGRNLGFILTQSSASLTKKIDTIEADCVYSAHITLGVRNATPKHRHFGSYEIALLSGDTVLATTASDSPPCPPNGFATVNLSWDSNRIPENLKTGAPLSIRISTQTQREGSGAYLDFSHLKVSKLRYRD